MDIKRAAEILGVEEDADIAKIERKYGILVRQYRQYKITDADDSKMDIDEINEAVRALRAARGAFAEEAGPPRRESKLLKKVGVDEKKLRNNIYYYKWHVIIGVAALAIIIGIVTSIVTKVTPEVNIIVIGDFTEFYQENLEQAILDSQSGIKAVMIDSAIGSAEFDMIDYAVQMKKTVLLAAAAVDIYICDQAFYEEMAEQGIFIKIEDFFREHDIIREYDNAGMIDALLAVSSGKYEYGECIPSGSKFYDIINGNEVTDTIVCIASKVKNIENTVKIISLLLM